MLECLLFLTKYLSFHKICTNNLFTFIEVLNDCRLREPDLQREYGYGPLIFLFLFKRNNIISHCRFLRKLQNPRLKHYLHSYFSRREQFTDVESPKARIIQTEFITNEYGEYSFRSVSFFHK